MKINFLKKTVFATMLLAGLVLTSCKSKTDEGDDKGSDDTAVTETTTDVDTTKTATDTLVTKTTTTETDTIKK